MSNNQALATVRGGAIQKFEFTPAAYEMRDNALAAGALLNKVNNAEEQKAAVAAQVLIAEFLKVVEKARKAGKEPALEYGRQVDEETAKLIKEPKEEQLRLAKIVSDFQQLEQAKVRAAQQAENERLLQIERERAKEMAKAESHEELNKVAEKYDSIAKDEAPAPVMTARAEQQVVKDEWEFEVTDIWALARAHPACVKIEPRRSEIKAMLMAGQKVAGIRAELVTKATVRTRTHQAISV